MLLLLAATTASLVKLILKVDPKWVHPLPLDVPTIIPNTEVTVTLIEANHCVLHLPFVVNITASTPPSEFSVHL